MYQKNKRMHCRCIILCTVGLFASARAMLRAGHGHGESKVGSQENGEGFAFDAPENYELDRLWDLAEYPMLDDFDTAGFEPPTAETLKKLEFCRWAVSKTCTGQKTPDWKQIKKARNDFQSGDEWLLGKAAELKGTKPTKEDWLKIIDDINVAVRNTGEHRPGEPSERRLNPSAIKGIVFPLDKIQEGLERFAEALATKISAGKSPVAVAAYAFQGLNTIHPFADGNGRTCVFIADLVLMMHGLPPPAWGTYSPVDPIPVCKKDFEERSYSDEEAEQKVHDAGEAFLTAMDNTREILAGTKHCSDTKFSVQEGPKDPTKISYCTTKADCLPNTSTKNPSKKIKQNCCVELLSTLTPLQITMASSMVNTCVAAKHSNRCTFAEA